MPHVSMHRPLVPAFAFALAMAGAGLSAHADNATFNEPDLDRWNYPFASAAAFGANGSTFGALFPGNAGMFDERDAQVVLGFDTAAAGVPTGQGVTNYQITSVQLTITTNRPVPPDDGGFAYDPTYDAFSSYLLPFDPRFTPDFDTGRPIELYGLGFRNGFTMLDFASPDDGTPGYGEDDGFAPPAVPFSPAGTRHAFAADVATGVTRDVSNNVDFDPADGFEDHGGFNPTPFAIGQTSDVNPGDNVGMDVTFTFDVDVSDPNILNYLRSSLNDGKLGFAVSSLHPAEQGGDLTFPTTYLRSIFVPNSSPATLSIDYTIGPIPEPTTAVIVTLVGAAVASRRTRRRRG